MMFIEKNGKRIFYKVIFKHNKNTYYRVKPGHVEVTTNKDYPQEMMIQFLVRHFDKFDDMIHQQIVEKDDELMLWGHTYRLEVHTGNFKYRMDEQAIYVHSRSDILATKRRIYLDQLKQKSAEISTKIEPVLAQQHISLIPLKYKYLKSKFGSYHRRHHEITLNTILARLDPIFLEYVLYHEYAHTKVFNHSARFYALLDVLMPGHKTIQKRLKNVVII